MRYRFSLLSCFVMLAFVGVSTRAAELFNGRDFTGWEFVTNPATDIQTVCKILPEGVIAATGRPIGFIASKTSYENYRFHAEWRWSDKAGNGGILIHISSGPKDRAWPLSLQIQTKHKNAGDLLPMAGATFAEPLTTEPGAKTPIKARTGSVDTEKPVGEWNSCDIVCENATVEVSINGVLQNKVTNVTPRTGRVGFQFEGTAFQIRHVTLTPLK